jgi:UDP-N-acetylglucosamine 1-carboxyvinyltransferase
MTHAIEIQGGAPLRGKVMISGSKNAALPIMASALLSSGPLRLDRLPNLRDIHTMQSLIAMMGVSIDWDPSAGTMVLSAPDVPLTTTAPYDLVRQMRASAVVLGPLLARYGTARLSLPGGCAIGTRPIDWHLYGLEAMGADIRLDSGYIEATTHGKRLRGAVIDFPRRSVGATENILMAACLAEGTTVIRNAAEEPEINDLAECLRAMGAQIDGVGTDCLTIEGQLTLAGAEHRIMPDRIEAGTYAVAALLTDGVLDLQGIHLPSMENILATLRSMGALITVSQDGQSLLVQRSPLGLRPAELVTAPYPGFPTDMQAQLMVLMSVIAGETSSMTETVFENRFMHVPELNRMGASIAVQGSKALLQGMGSLRGAEVMATDLRASVSLILAGLVAEGRTTVHRIYHLDRGYERLEEKLTHCGATIRRYRLSSSEEASVLGEEDDRPSDVAMKDEAMLART